MAHERLGLFDSPPDRRETQIATLIIGVLFVAFPLILTVHDVRLRHVEAFIPVIDAIMFPCELIIAAELFAEAAVFRSQALIILASGFVFGALLLVPHLLIPGCFLRKRIAWSRHQHHGVDYTFRRAGFPIAVILYVHFRQAEKTPMSERDRSAVPAAIGVFAAIALAAAVTLMATIGRDLLPPFFSNHTDRIQGYAVAYHSTISALFFIAAAMLFRKRNSVLDMWLLVALLAWLFQSLLM